MPEVKLGRLVLEKRFVRRFTDPLFIAVEEYRCERKGGGIYVRHNAPLDMKPRIVTATLQARELKRMLEALRGLRPPVRNLDQLAARLKDILSLSPVQVDLKHRPESWRRGSKCFDVIIGYYRIYEVYEIIVRAAQQLKLGGETYPKNDIVAAFTISKPAGYQFARKNIYNPRCCPRRMGHSVPRDSEIRGHEILVLEAETEELELDPELWKHFEREWRLPRFRWRIRPEWDFHPRSQEEEDEKFKIGIRYRF